MYTKSPALIDRLIRCPDTPSKTIRAFFPKVLVAGFFVSPGAMRPVNSMSAAVKSSGGIKKSPLLTAAPPGVVTDIRPEPVRVGTLVTIAVAFAELAHDLLMLNVSWLLPAVVSKLVPVRVTVVPAEPMVGVNPLIVGGPTGVVTVKVALLVDEPVGAVTEIGPEVAPTGTLVVICAAEAAITAAVTPLNFTVFSLATSLKPVP